jgi:hypothetical protein
MDAMTRMKKSSETHRAANPGHVVVERDGTDIKGRWASWTCETCAENATRR